MKNTGFDNQLKKALQEQAALFEPPADTEQEFQKVWSRLQEQNMEETKMKHLNMKKVVIATVAAVMVLGTVSIASGKITGVISGSRSNPDYTRYMDLQEAENTAGVITDAPETFSNGYRFCGINLADNSYQNEDRTIVDNFKSLSIKYKKESDSITYDVQPRPALIKDAAAGTDMFDVFEENGTTYYYLELHNKWVPLGYEPTEEEQAQMEAGTLNIGVGASEISYSDSKQLFWEKDGHERSLFCMDVDISKEELVKMALEIE